MTTPPSDPGPETAKQPHTTPVEPAAPTDTRTAAGTVWHEPAVPNPATPHPSSVVQVAAGPSRARAALFPAVVAAVVAALVGGGVSAAVVAAAHDQHDQRPTVQQMQRWKEQRKQQLREQRQHQRPMPRWQDAPGHARPGQRPNADQHGTGPRAGTTGPATPGSAQQPGTRTS